MHWIYLFVMKNINCEEEDYTVTWLSSFPTLQANYTLYHNRSEPQKSFTAIPMLF